MPEKKGSWSHGWILRGQKTFGGAGLPSMAPTMLNKKLRTERPQALDAGKPGKVGWAVKNKKSNKRGEPNQTKAGGATNPSSDQVEGTENMVRGKRY